MTKLTPKNSPQYLTVKECQDICRFRGPDAIRRAVYREELVAIRVSANRNLISADSFWKWFHRNDVQAEKSKTVQMPAGEIKKPKRQEQAA